MRNGAPSSSDGLPPHQTDAEEGILASILVNQQTLVDVLPIVDGKDFYRKRNGAIFDTMCALYEAEQPIDFVTLGDALVRRGPDAADDILYLSGLLDKAQPSVSAVAYAGLVADAAARRRLISAGARIAQLAFAADQPPDATVAQAENLLASVLTRSTQQEWADSADVLGDYLDDLRARTEGAGSTRRVPTGFPSLDAMLGGGWEPSDLIILAARPSIGKTNLALALALAASGAGTGVAMFSLEMAARQLIGRLLSMTSGIEAAKLREPDRMTTLDTESLLGPGIEAVANARIAFDDTPSLAIQTLRSRLVRLRRRRDIGLVIVDHLQLLRLDRRFDNRVQEVTEISRLLKALAREQGLPVIVVSQLSRAVEQRPKKIPALSDLRESGSIEQDADLVLLLYRDDYYNRPSLRPNTLDVIVAKHRNGPVGTVTLGIQPTTLSFSEVPEGQESADVRQDDADFFDDF